MSSKICTLFRGQRATLDAEHLAALETYRGAVWFHAASVGEFEQARPIIERLKAKGAGTKVIVTFFSPSGYEARKNFELADGVFYLPIATRRNAKRFLDALQPTKAIFVKYEFWPAYLKELSKRSIPTYSICSIFRPTQRFFHWYGFSARRVLKCFTHLFVQDEASRELLVSHGINQCSVAGDTRFDRVAAIMANGRTANSERLTPVAQFVEGATRVIVAGSTWPQDEELLAKYVERMNGLMGEGVKLILVPHEIDETHIHYLFNLFQGRAIRYSFISGMPSDMSRLTILQHAQVMIIDTMGMLSSLYRFGHVAYIGGGFGVGIHNTIEAAVYGVPVIFGPNYRHFREAQGLIDANAARTIKNYSELEAALDTALDQHETIGAKAADYVQSELGATDKIYKYIFS